jgi:intracellular sulfur oxidation DsrE/DsrF family protein
MSVLTVLSSAGRMRRVRFSPLRRALALTAFLTAAAALGAQAPTIPGQQMSGPVITSTGMSIKVDDPTFVIPASHVFKAVFEINVGGGDTAQVNAQLSTVARYYNLHVRHGVPGKQVRAAAVFHGSGWTALLTDAAFAARFSGKPNPSRALTEELLQHGAQMVLCGQTAGVRGIRRDELLPGVKVAISAMSAMQVFQSDGYAFIAW